MQTPLQRNKRALTDVSDNDSRKTVCVRSKEVCNARLLLLSCNVEWDSPNLDNLGPLPSKRTKSGYVGTFECGNRWQAQYLHRTVGAYDTAYEAGSAVARAVARLAGLKMIQDSNEVVFEGQLSNFAAKGLGEQAGAKGTPAAEIGKSAAAVLSSAPADPPCQPNPSSAFQPVLHAPIPVRIVHSGYPSGNISSLMPARSSMPQAAPYLCSGSTQATSSMPMAPRPDMLTAPRPEMRYEPQDKPIAPGHLGASSVGRAPSFSAPSNGPLTLLPFTQQPFNGLNSMSQPAFFQQPVYMPEPGFTQNYSYGYTSTLPAPPSSVPQMQAAPPFLPPPADMAHAHGGWNNYAPNVQAWWPSVGPSGDEECWYANNSAPYAQLNYVQ